MLIRTTPLEAPVRDYRSMTPCERIRYYQKRVRELTPTGSAREALLVRTFEHLIRENLPLCSEHPAIGPGTDGRS